MDVFNKKVWEFYRIFQDLMKCAECEETLTKIVFMCGNGHSICSNCHKQKIQCKQCNAPYTLMKNVLIQNLLLEFTDIKVCLDESNVPKIQSNLTKIVNANNTHYYFCCADTKCQFKGCLKSIIDHLQSSSHPKRFFKEHQLGTMPFMKYWDMFYTVEANYSRTVQIPEIGVFTLYVWKDNNKLKFCVVMYACNLVASQYSYTISVECYGMKQNFSSQVKSAEIPKQCIRGCNNDRAQLTLLDHLYEEILNERIFKCSLIIKQNDIVNDNINNSCCQLTLVNTPSKKKEEPNRQEETQKVALVQGTNKKKQIIVNIHNSHVTLNPNLICSEIESQLSQLQLK